MRLLLHTLRSGLVIGVLGVLAGCASPNSPTAIMDRVDANRDEYETWPHEIKEAVLSGRAVKGMTPRMVLVARGKPIEVVDRGNGDEIWVYRKGESQSSFGSGLPSGASVSIGGGGSGYPGSGYPGSGYPSSGVGIYVPPIVLGGGGGGFGGESVDEETVVFREGVVTRGDGLK